MYSVCLCLVASASSLNDIAFWKKEKKENSENLVASLLLNLLLEVAGTTILLDNLHGRVVLVVAHGGALPFAVGHQRD